MTEEQLKELEGVIAALPARPQSYSYEGQIRPTAKSTGYADYHVHSICGGPDTGTETENHHCIGNVIAKDEDTAARLARLIEAAPALLDEVVRLRAAFTRLADDENVDRWISETEDQCGGDGVRCAYKEVQEAARRALSGGV